MFICTELIEETGRLLGLIFECLDIFAWIGEVRVLEKFTHLTEL